MIDFKEGLWYFAHPYTCKNNKGEYVTGGEDANFRLCCYRAAKLIEMGYVIYSPISHTHPIHMSYPPFVGQEVHDMWYELDNKFIRLANFTGIILAPGWENSKGCVAEKELFESLNRAVVYYEHIQDYTTGIHIKRD